MFDHVIPTQRIGNPQPANLYIIGRPDLLYTFSKISLWRQTRFRKIVYIDADVVALRAPDELFDIQDSFAAAPDVGWPDIFNTGVMVLSPSEGEYSALRTHAAAADSFDGADQGLLNQYFEHRPWRWLSFVYNCTPSASYQYEPAYRYYKTKISLAHFIGPRKPWKMGRQATVASTAYQELLSRWWAVYDRHFQVTPDEFIAGRTAATRYDVNSDSSPQTVRASPTEGSLTPRGGRSEDVKTMTERTAESQHFSAPKAEWDATRGPPPSKSQPEAASFPTRIYEFNTSTDQFRPPQQYPEPPKDVQCEVPSTPPSGRKLPAIFPWEERKPIKPARRFIEDEPPVVKPTSEKEVDFSLADEFAVQDDGGKEEPQTPKIRTNESTLWKPYDGTKNAWDEVSGIEEYVRALAKFQQERANPHKTQTDDRSFPEPVSTAAGRSSQQTHILSPSNEPDPAQLVREVQRRRQSMLITDFPTAVERPSLSVTPAPVGRATSWAPEKDEAVLPVAQGVPDQADWVSAICGSFSLGLRCRLSMTYARHPRGLVFTFTDRKTASNPCI